MSHSLTRIWIHAVWTTKARMPMIEPRIEARVHSLLGKQLSKLGCYVNAINGMPDHVHCLFMMNSQTSIADTIKQIKAATSFEINSQAWLANKFAWQSGYSAYSVSESALTATREYILKQKQHHRSKPIQPVV